MDTWLIYLIVTLLITLFAGQALFLKRFWRRWLLPVGLVAVIIIVVPTILLWHSHNSEIESNKKEVNSLIEKFNESYGEDEYNQLVGANKMETFLITRGKLDDNGNLDLTLGTKTSMLVGDSWLELQVMDSEDESESDE